MSTWHWTYHDYCPERERHREALCTLGNGYFATRGALPEATADEIHYPGTYLAGGYDRLKSEVQGNSVENEDLVNLPNWLVLRVRIGDGDWLDPDSMQLLSYYQCLALHDGVLLRDIRFRDPQGRETRVVQRRFVHMRNRHLAALQTDVTALNWSGPIEVISALDGSVTNDGVARYRGLEGRHLEVFETCALEDDAMLLRCRTRQSRVEIAMAARTCAYRDGRHLPLEPSLDDDGGRIAQSFRLDLAEDQPLRIEKVVALCTSRDSAISECAHEACKQIRSAADFDTLLEDHRMVWDQLWRRFDLALTLRDDDGGCTMRILRMHLFHLLVTASPHVMDLDVGVPARGLHGEAYRGHIFWDELFIFPILDLRLPEITRSLLLYRYRRLGEARAAAHAIGLRGAMFPWQSGSDGREESQRLHLNPRSGRWTPDETLLQRHIGSAVAYNVWQYYETTNDTEFLSFYGAEMLLEIARFWASKATYNQNLDRYEICGVVGPDEFHTRYPERDEAGLDNHAYTTLMATWVLCRALALPEHLPNERWQELTELLGIDADELAHWDRVSRKLRLCFHDDGIISQFEGFEELLDLDWAHYRQKYGDIQRLDRILEAEGDSPNRYKATKQADVLMLFYLFSAEELGRLFTRLGYALDDDMIPHNVAYYSARTSHGSTLSRVVDAWVLARSDRPRSWSLFAEALQSDVGDIQGGTTSEGIHLGAMAGTVDLIQRCYTGIEIRDDRLWLNPRLPDELTSLCIRVRFRGQTLGLDIKPEAVRVRAISLGNGHIRVCANGEEAKLCADESHEVGRDAMPFYIEAP